MEYLAPEDFEIAAENGISEDLAKSRFYKYGWTKKRSITQKPQRLNLWKEYKERCEEIGLSQAGFYSRIRQNKMTPEEAVNTPLIPKGGVNPKITDEIVGIAKGNGISHKTLAFRVYVLKWDVEKAMTKPIDKSKRKKSIVTSS